MLYYNEIAEVADFVKDSLLKFITFMYEEEKYYFKKRNFLNLYSIKAVFWNADLWNIYYCQIESRTDA